jgi:hypothetical protein
LVRSFAVLESAARECCLEILERSGVDWPNTPAAERPLFTSLINNAHAWVQDVTNRQAQQTGLDPTELLGVVVDQLRDEHGWDVALSSPWMMYAAGSCRSCGLAMPLASLGSHLRRCLADEPAMDEWRRKMN